MSDAVLAALITAGLGALAAIVVEVIRRRRPKPDNPKPDKSEEDPPPDPVVTLLGQKLDAVLAQISPNSGKSLHDTVTRIDRRVGEVAELQRQHGERLAAVEARVSDHLARS